MKENDIDYEALSISEAVLSSARLNLQKTAITYLGKKITYKKLIEKIEKLALSFYSMGVKRGEVVMIALPNIPQAVYVLYALNRIGAVASFVSPLSAEAEFELYLKKCNANVVVVLESLYDKIAKVLRKSGDKKLVITSPFDELGLVLKKSGSDAIAWGTMYKTKGKKSIYISSQRKNDTAVILFTGGTTGTPKAVELTNLNLNALATGTEAVCVNNVRGVRMLSVLPVFHGFGLGICIHTVLYFGGNILMVPRFDSEKTGKIISRRKPHYIAGVPSMFSSLINTKSMKKADLSMLNGVFSGGDSLSRELESSVDQFLYDHGAKVKIRQGYGLTECVAASCLMPLDTSKFESVGKPYPDTFYKIVKINTCDEVEHGETGEICISGKTVMKGYLGEKEETENVLKCHADGRLWLHTGDMGYIDKEGFVYFKQRLKRVIVTNGYNVYPSEIEKALLKHPLVQDCCAVGVKDSLKIQAVALFVVMNNTEDATEKTKAELIEYLKMRLSKQSQPKYLYFIDRVPKTDLGKAAYAELEKLAEENIK